MDGNSGYLKQLFPLTGVPMTFTALNRSMMSQMKTSCRGTQSGKLCRISSAISRSLTRNVGHAGYGDPEVRHGKAFLELQMTHRM